MVRPVDDIVDLLSDRLRLSAQPAGTMLWRDFYTLCDMQRFKEPRGDQIKDRARDKYGLLVTYGREVVTISHDRNFAPI